MSKDIKSKEESTMGYCRMCSKYAMINNVCTECGWIDLE